MCSTFMGNSILKKSLLTLLIINGNIESAEVVCHVLSCLSVLMEITFFLLKSACRTNHVAAP